MKPPSKPALVSADELPEIADELAVNPALKEELAELLATLSALETPDTSGVAAGRARLLSAVTQSTERYAPLFGKLTEFFDLSVESLRAVFARAELASEWTPGPLPWVSLFHLEGGPAVAGLDTGFVRLKKGMPFPRHRHVGPEHVMILSGGYHDNDGRWYGPGDLHVMAIGTEHSLQMSAEEDVLLAVILAANIEVVGA
jgi:quercetin dioxygenase-like cupin family protein